MKPYAVGHIGEWFMVVFHNSAKEAKKLGWQHYPDVKISDNYLELDVKLLDARYNILAESDEPHVIMSFNSEWEHWDEYVNELWGRYLNQYEL